LKIIVVVVVVNLVVCRDWFFERMYSPKFLKNYRDQEIEASAPSLEEYTLDRRTWDKVITSLNTKSEDRTEKQIDRMFNLFSPMKFFSQLPIDVAKECIRLFGYTKLDRHATGDSYDSKNLYNHSN
jgi:hypothetical protein